MTKKLNITLNCLALLLLLDPCISIGQLKLKIDKITGDTLFMTSAETLYRKPSFHGTLGEKLDFAVSNAKGIKVLSLIARTGESDTYVIGTSDELLLKLQDGSLIKLLPAKAEVSEYSFSSRGGYWTAHYILDAASIQKLSNSVITHIRVNHSDGKIDYALKEKFQKLIGRNVSLLL